MDQLDADLAAALRMAGVEPTEQDLALVRLVHGAYGPALSALLGDAVTDLPLEPGLDPSRPPA